MAECTMVELSIIIYVRVVHEQARPLIHGRNSPTSSRYDLAHALIATLAAPTGQIAALSAINVWLICLTSSGSPQDDAASP